MYVSEVGRFDAVEEIRFEWRIGRGQRLVKLISLTVGTLHVIIGCHATRVRCAVCNANHPSSDACRAGGRVHLQIHRAASAEILSEGYNFARRLMVLSSFLSSCPLSPRPLSPCLPSAALPALLHSALPPARPHIRSIRHGQRALLTKRNARSSRVVELW